MYEVYVRSFSDSGGDGVGDLEGIRRGCRTWCRSASTPCGSRRSTRRRWPTTATTSPTTCDVDPLFGDLAAFDALLADAHAAGLRVVVDVVPNHSSSGARLVRRGARRPGVADARRATCSARAADGGPPNNWTSVFGGRAWTQVPDGAWYLHLFDSGQPDLDWRSPEVHVEWERILRFWLDRGVDGFRIDVAHSLYKAEGLPDAPETGVGGDFDALDQPQAWDRPEVVRSTSGGARSRTPTRRPDDGRRGVPARRRQGAALRRPDPAAPGLQLHASWRSRSTGRALRDRRRAGARVLRHGHLGAVATTTSSATPRATAAATSAGGAASPSPPCCWRCPARPTSTRGRSWASRRPRCRPPTAQDPIFRRTGGAVPGRDGCRTPMPWTADGARARLHHRRAVAAVRRRRRGPRRRRPGRATRPRCWRPTGGCSPGGAALLPGSAAA